MIKNKRAMQSILLCLLGLLSETIWADCELRNSSASAVATCYEKESFKKINKNLNKLIQLSKAQLSDNKNILEELNSSQKAWLNYRDRYCTTYSNYHFELNNHANCIINLNEQRAKQLQADIDAN